MATSSAPMPPLRPSDTEVIEIVSLHQQEVWLLKALRRKLRFGEVTILVRDGLPVRLKRVTEVLSPQDALDW